MLLSRAQDSYDQVCKHTLMQTECVWGWGLSWSLSYLSIPERQQQFVISHDSLAWLGFAGGQAWGSLLMGFFAQPEKHVFDNIFLPKEKFFSLTIKWCLLRCMWTCPGTWGFLLQVLPVPCRAALSPVGIGQVALQEEPRPGSHSPGPSFSSVADSSVVLGIPFPLLCFSNI